MPERPQGREALRGAKSTPDGSTSARTGDRTQLRTTPAVSLRMSRQVSRDTGIERTLRSVLHARGLRFRVHRRPILGLRREVDLVFPSARVAVFVDGCFWHGCPEHATWPRSNPEFWQSKIEGNRSRDRDTESRLEAEGWAVCRIWEHEDVGEAADRVARVVAERRELVARKKRPHM